MMDMPMLGMVVLWVLVAALLVLAIIAVVLAIGRLRDRPGRRDTEQPPASSV
jgi:hypothetical protein